MSREMVLSTTTEGRALVRPASGEDEASVVELEIERTREKILASLRRLRSEVSEVTDWRKQVGRRPWIFVAGALGFGVLLGLMTTRTGKEIRS